MPDDVDWARRYLRRRGVPCEGEQLQAALESLDGPSWQRMKNAARQQTARRCGPAARMLEGLWRRDQRLGPVWQRLIAWGVISEDDARLLASDIPQNSPAGFGFTNVWAKLVLSVVLGHEVDKLRKKAAGPRGGLHAAVIDFMAICFEAGPPELLDERVVKDLVDGGCPYPEAAIRAAIADLKASGQYQQAIERLQAEVEAGRQQE
jgi:hypothetical protein